MNKMLSHLIMNYECEDFIEKMEQEHFNGSTGFKINKQTSCWAFRCKKGK
jgi:hypothetical protein